MNHSKTFPDAAQPLRGMGGLLRFFNGLSDAMLVCNLDGQILYSNEPAQLLLGQTEHQLHGGRIQTIISTEATVEISLNFREAGSLLNHHVEYGGKSLEFTFLDDLAPDSGFAGTYIQIRPVTAAAPVDYRSVLQTSMSAIFLLDREFRIEFLNTRGRELLKYYVDLPGDGLGIPFMEAVPPERKYLVNDVLQRCMQGEELSYQALYETAGKPVYWFMVTYTPLFDDLGQVDRISITANDITSLKIKEAQLIQSEQRWKFALEGAGDGVWEYNFKTRESYYSPTYKNMLGFRDDEFRNDSEEWRNRIHPEDLHKVLNIDRLYERGVIVQHSVEYRIRNKQDDWTWVLDRGMLLERSPDGHPLKLVGTQKDITFGKRSEEALRQSEERYYQMVDSVEDYAIMMLNEKGFVLNWNKGAQKIKGYKSWEIIGKSFQVFYTPEDVASGHPKHLLQRALITGNSTDEGWRVKKDGSRFWASVTITLVRDKEQKILGFSKVTRDLTARKMAEDLLRKSEAQFSEFMDNTPTMNWIIDEHNVMRYLNRSYMKAFRLDRSAIGKSIYELFPREVCDLFVENNWKVWTQDKALEEYEEGFGPDGSQQVYHSYKFPLPPQDGVRLLGGVSLDITQQEMLEKQLAQEEDLRKREIIQAIIDAQEKERKKLAYELHDNVNQILTSSRLMLEVAAEKPDLWQEFVKNSMHYLQTAIEEIRHISHSLTPGTLEDIGLDAAVQEIIQDLNKTGKLSIAYRKKMRTPSAEISQDIQLTALRIVQEQLNNILKHAVAETAIVTLHVTEKLLRLEIQDDGVGFDVNSTKKGLGLNSIYNRAEYYHGRVRLETKPGSGCLLCIEIPLTAPAA